MKFTKNSSRMIILLLSILTVFSVISMFVFSTSATESLYNINSAIVFDLSKGNVSFTDGTYSGKDSSGADVTGAHDPENVYVVMQSTTTATNYVIKVGDAAAAVTKKFEIHLHGVNIDAPKTTANHAPAVYVNTASDTVYLILDNGTQNEMHAYAHIFSTKGVLDSEEKRFGHAAIEKEINTQGTLVVTCESGYNAYLSNNTHGHDCQKNGNCGSLIAQAHGEAGFSSSATRTAAAAAIGSKAEITQDSRTSLSNAPICGTLYNLTIAGGNITATGATGNHNNLTNFDNKKVYLGGSPGIGVGAGFQQYSIGYKADNISITGGYITAIAGDGSSANIGGGYHAGYVTVNIYGGTIDATQQLINDNKDNAAVKRGAGIGGGGGGTTSNATAGATVNIHGGTITAFSSYGAAIGAGAGGEKGIAQPATVNISGGTITASTVKGTYNDGAGAGAAIGAGGSLGTGKGGKAEITITGNPTITASSEGGADIGGGGTNSTDSNGVGGEGIVTISGGTITATTGGIGGGKANAGIGGGSSAKSSGGDCTVTISGGHAEVKHPTGVSIGGGNGATNGGKATLNVSGEAELTTGSIGGGNGLTIGSANVTISGGTLQGQVIMSGSGSTFTMTGGILDNSNAATAGFNFVKENGGAVYMEADDGVTKISGGTIQNCSGVDGGAVYMTQGTLTLSGGSITNCTASNNGGAIYLGGGTVTLSGGSITNCTATTGNGGGVYLGGGTMTVSGGSITSCKAINGNGGGAYVNAGSAQNGILVTGGTIAQNTASQNGGGVAVNNGYYKMTGGTVDRNKAINGSGGGIYVASTDIKVDVSVFSGSVTNNEAGTSGGAVAVAGGDNSKIDVTVGVNDIHTTTDGICTHIYNNGTQTCPVIESNSAGISGGAIYITGGETTNLNTYCLVEDAGRSNSAGENTQSCFMMVEGGKVLLSTLDTANTSTNHGNIQINGTIHVLAGDMLIEGSMANPLINATITVDVTTERGSFKDNRQNSKDAPPYYKIQYFENFTDPITNKKTGQYKVFQVKEGDKHTILPTLYVHDGYMIDGWWTTENAELGNGTLYDVNKEITWDKETGDLILYAKWLPVGYYVYFNPGVDSYSGNMETKRYDRDVSNVLPQNGFFYTGYIFDGWSTVKGGEKVYDDAQSVVNLTTERGITLYAVWKVCAHDDEAYFTYSSSGTNKLVRTCSCKACTQNATLTAENRVYDPNISYQADLVVVTDVTNGQSSDALRNWSPQPVYTGTKFDGTEFTDGEFLKAAGEYEVSISVGDVLVRVPFKILKAERKPPEKPEYKSNETDNSVIKGKIVIIPPIENQLNDYLEYQVVWYVSGGAKKVSDIQSLSHASNERDGGFSLDDNYTNYYVYARYRGDNNYNETGWIMADSVLYYTGNVYFFITCAQGINYNPSSLPEDQGLVINVIPEPENTYYLYNTKISHDKAKGYNGDIVITRESNSKHVITSIPKSTSDSINIYLEITGVKKHVKITSAVTASEKFNTISGNTASITRDSAYTAYFEIQNDYDVYTNPQLTFSQSLPANTTVIFVDKTNSVPVYYSHKVGNEGATTIALSSFVRMDVQTSGTATFSPPASSTAVLKYQFIVDFSDSNGGLENKNDLETTFSAVSKPREAEKGVPDFPASRVSVTLSDSVTSAVTVVPIANDKIKNKVTINYLNSPDGVTASKWENRGGALILSHGNGSALPPDARIKVTDKNGNVNTYYRNTNDQYVIPLSGSANLTLELVSDLFPVTDVTVTYSFDGKLYSACSSAGSACLNGDLLQDNIAITFTKAVDDTEPSLQINGDKKVYAAGETVTVTITAKNIPENTTLRLRLLYKQAAENSTYMDTGIKQEIPYSDSGNSLDSAQATISLGGTITAGSGCVLLEILGAYDIIMSVPYYFVITENTQ